MYLDSVLKASEEGTIPSHVNEMKVAPAKEVIKISDEPEPSDNTVVKFDKNWNPKSKWKLRPFLLNCQNQKQKGTVTFTY